MEKQKFYEMIEQYLEGQLSQNELDDFELQIKQDAQFAKEVQLHQAIHNELEDKTKLSLRKNLGVLKEEFAETPVVNLPPQKSIRGSKRWLAIAASLLLASLAIWYFTNRPSSQAPIIVDDKNDLPQSIEVQPKDEIPIDEVQEEIVNEDKIPSSSNQEKQEPKIIEDKSQAPKINNTQLAFEPNSKMENLLANNLSNDKYNFSFESPNFAEGLNYENGNLDIVFAGKFLTSEDLDDKELVLEIYNNKIVFPEGNTLFSKKIEMKEKEEEGFAFANEVEFEFEEFVQTKLPEGLYYFILSEKGNSKILWMNKTILKNK